MVTENDLKCTEDSILVLSPKEDNNSCYTHASILSILLQALALKLRLEK